MAVPNPTYCACCRRPAAVNHRYADEQERGAVCTDCFSASRAEASQPAPPGRKYGHERR